MAFASPEPAPTFNFFRNPAPASACALFRNPDLLRFEPTNHAQTVAYLKEMRLTDKFCRECPTLESTNPNFDDYPPFFYKIFCPTVARVQSNIRLSIVESSTNIIFSALKLIGKK